MQEAHYLHPEHPPSHRSRKHFFFMHNFPKNKFSLEILYIVEKAQKRKLYE